MRYLTLLYEAFRFIKRYRQRQAEASEAAARERAAEREHQRVMVTSALQQIVELAKINQGALVTIAEAQAETARTLTAWLKSFQVDPSQGPFASHTVSEQDEWLEEQRQLGEKGFPVDLPPEFQLAYALDKAVSLGSTTPADFDREGHDNI